MSAPLALALVHHPVLDRGGRTVTAAVTNLDLHDLARIARTYGVARVYVATPADAQRRLVEELLAHWRTGFGATYNPRRAEALELVATARDLDEILADWERSCGQECLPLLTGARLNGGLDFPAARRCLSRQPGLLVLGTGWGLAPELFARGWPCLEPVAGQGGYNHLPVRAAAAIMLDRLRGPR